MSVSITVDATGVHVPPFSEVLTGVQGIFQGIYGADIYLGADSQDGQLAGAIALMLSDCNNACAAAWANFSPLTAVGVGLSSMVKLNGLQRIAATNSTALVDINGTVGTEINNGVIADSGGQQWNLPPVVVIGDFGTVAVTATCATPGSITAAPGALNNINTPVTGWQNVSNAAAATVGKNAESDGALRSRQAISTKLPSLTVLAAILANVENVPGVTNASAVENDTNATDANGLPAHSFAVVVSGGDSVAVATAIMNSKNPGPTTIGTTSETLTNSIGNLETISFSVPTQVHIAVSITVKAATGYTSTVSDEIKQALIDSQATNHPGEDVKWASLFIPAQLVNTPYSADTGTFSVTLLKIARSGSPAELDVVIAYNELAVIALGDITLTVT